MTKKKVKKKVRKSQPKKVERSKIKLADYQSYFYLGLVIIGLIYMIFAAAPYTEFALDRDEGTYINMGEKLLEGGDMYVDAYGMKPPASFYSYALINAFFGYSGSGLRWSLIVANTLAALFLFLFMRRWKGDLAGCIAALAYSIFAFNPFIFGFAALIEHYQNLIVIAALALMHWAIAKEKWTWVGVAGFLMTYNVLFKQNVIFFYAAIFIALAWYFLLETEKRNWRPIINFIAGSAVASIVVFIPLFIQGTFDDWWYWNLVYSREYTTGIPWSQGKSFLKSFMRFVTGFNEWMWYAGILGIIIALFFTKGIARRLALGLGLLATVVTIFPGLRFYPHYWSYFSPVLAIGCGWLFYALADQAGKKIKSPLPEIIALVLFLGGVGYVISENKDFFSDPKEMYVNRRMYGDNPFTESRILGEYLQKQMRDTDKLLVVGSEPQVYTFVGQTNLVPSMFYTPLVVPHERRDAMVDATIAKIEATPPEYAYFSNHPFSWGMTPDADPKIYNYISSMLQRDYQVVGIADILGGGQSPKIILGDQATGYQIQSQKWVAIYKRKGI